MNDSENYDHIQKLYRLLSEEEWDKFIKQETYQGTSFDKSTGFLHFSFKEQVKKTAEKFFGSSGILIVLEIDRSKLKSEKLIFEKNTPFGETYPHYYDVLDVTAAVKIFKGIALNLNL